MPTSEWLRQDSRAESTSDFARATETLFARLRQYSRETEEKYQQWKEKHSHCSSNNHNEAKENEPRDGDEGLALKVSKPIEGHFVTQITGIGGSVPASSASKSHLYTNFPPYDNLVDTLRDSASLHETDLSDRPDVPSIDTPDRTADDTSQAESPPFTLSLSC
jgi:hypothetical protein